MTEVELSTLLSDLKESGKQLNQASDSINSTISSIEQQIVEANVGLECWLPDRPLETSESKSVLWNAHGDFGQTWTQTILGFAKVGQTWRIAIRDITFVAEVVAESDEGDETGEPQASYGPPSALWQASRQLRIRALEEMPALIKNLGDAAKKAIKSIEDAKLLVK
jgi:hypothetical protein